MLPTVEELAALLRDPWSPSHMCEHYFWLVVKSGKLTKQEFADLYQALWERGYNEAAAGE